MTQDLSFLDLSPKKRCPPWTTARVVFIGGEGYEMISVDAEVCIESVPGGFQTRFRQPFAVPSELLLGSCFREAKVFDIEIRVPGFVMSMAKMYPASFPRVITPGQMVGINV